MNYTSARKMVFLETGSGRCILVAILVSITPDKSSWNYILEVYGDFIVLSYICQATQRLPILPMVTYPLTISALLGFALEHETATSWPWFCNLP